jgi:hypothetical protein
MAAGVFYPQIPQILADYGGRSCRRIRLIRPIRQIRPQIRLIRLLQPRQAFFPAGVADSHRLSQGGR